MKYKLATNVGAVCMTIVYAVFGWWVLNILGIWSYFAGVIR